MPKARPPRSVLRACLLIAAVVTIGLVAPPALGAPTVVRGHAATWSPANVTIVRGSVVKWRSIHLTHNVYSYGANWSFGVPLAEGRSTKHRFSRRGVYRFRCTLHSTLVNGACNGMCGSVRVS